MLAEVYTVSMKCKFSFNIHKVITIHAETYLGPPKTFPNAPRGVPSPLGTFPGDKEPKICSQLLNKYYQAKLKHNSK